MQRALRALRALLRLDVRRVSLLPMLVLVAVLALVAHGSHVAAAAEGRGATLSTLMAQVGGDIDGEAADDQSGVAIALSADGSRVAIGAFLNDGTGNNAGHVRVFDWNGNAWVQAGADIDGEAAGDWSGSSVALSADGNRVAIGARENSGSGSSAGHVRVFDWNGGAWVQVGTDIDGEAASDRSGWDVALTPDGSRVAIGAVQNDGNGNSAGHVRVFDWNGSAWVQVGADIDGEAAGDECGRSVAFSADGSRLAIGAPNNDGNGNLAGHVRVFDWNGSAWLQAGSDIDGEAAEDFSGTAIALTADGNRLAIGARGNSGSGSAAGHVRVFDWNGSAWVQAGTDIDGETTWDSSGNAVAFSTDGSRLAIGSQNANHGVVPGPPGSGQVRVYDWSGSAWVQVDTDIDGEADEDQSGYSVALSVDGSRVAIGAPTNDGAGNAAGHVRVFSLTPVSVGVDPRPVSEFALAMLAPNPSAGPTKMMYVVGREARVHLSVVDVQGRVVAVLAEGLHAAGRYRAVWDGVITGGVAPAGIYFVRYQTPEMNFVRRLAITR